jgi:hypothetical protein
VKIVGWPTVSRGNSIIQAIEQAMPPTKRTIPAAKPVIRPIRRAVPPPPRKTASHELLAAAASVVWFAGWLQAIYDEVYESLCGPDRTVIRKPRALDNEARQHAEKDLYD